MTRPSLASAAAAICLIASSLDAAVPVHSQATGGSGTAASPWTGWDSAITWSADTTYRFEKGHYAYASSPNYLKPGIQLIGEAGVYLRHTGSGPAFVMDAGPTPGSVWIQNVRVENLIIYGNSATTDGFFLRGVRNGQFNHLAVKDVSGAAFRSVGCVTNVLQNFRCTYHEPVQTTGFLVRPKFGIVTEGRGGDWSTTWSIINPVIEGVSEVGIWFKADSYGNTIVNGTSEGNIGAAIGIRVDGQLNVITNLDVEMNDSGNDFLVGGSYNTFQGCLAQDNFNITGHHNTVMVGSYRNMNIAPDCYQNHLINPKVAQTFVDKGNDTRYVGVSGSDLRSRLGVVIPVLSHPTIPANGILVTNVAHSNMFTVYVDRDFTLANPLNPTNGQTVIWRFIQGGAQRTVTFGSQFVSLVGRMPVVPATGSWQFTATYNASAGGVWEIISIADGQR